MTKKFKARTTRAFFLIEKRPPIARWLSVSVLDQFVSDLFHRTADPSVRLDRAAYFPATVQYRTMVLLEEPAYFAEGHGEVFPKEIRCYLAGKSNVLSAGAREQVFNFYSE